MSRYCSEFASHVRMCRFIHFFFLCAVKSVVLCPDTHRRLPYRSEVLATNLAFVYKSVALMKTEKSMMIVMKRAMES